MSAGRRGGRASLCVLCFLCAFRALPLGIRVAAAQEPPGPQAVTAAQLQTAIAKLGNLDYAVARRLAHRPADTGGAGRAALLQAVAEHADGYVRYRALVLLTGVQRSTHEGRDARSRWRVPNDRLRTVAYSFFEHNPIARWCRSFSPRSTRSRREFVRPALVRALAALGPKNRARPPGTAARGARGEDFFRSAVIEALGDYKARVRVRRADRVAKLDGPLQDDAALALGKIGAKRALETLAGLQRPRRGRRSRRSPRQSACSASTASRTRAT